VEISPLAEPARCGAHFDVAVPRCMALARKQEAQDGILA
jgi:hypothetical protein